MDIITESSFNDIKPCTATIGFFDGVHKGHQFLISQLKSISAEKGTKSAVITFPVHPRKVLNDTFQPQLLSTEDEKIGLLGQTDIDYCILFPFTKDMAALSAMDFMLLLKEKYKVERLIIGYDHRFGHNRSEGFDDYCRYGKEIGIEVIHALEYDSNNIAISSSIIRKLIEDGKVGQANSLLGHRYSISGNVVNGYKIGRKLGYPTANVSPCSKDKILPCDGVYAVFVYIADKKFKGMLNIGNRPTVDNGSNKSIEVNIFDFESDIYNKDIKIEFVQFMRHEERYSSLELLTRQLDKDKANAIAILNK